MQQTGSQKAAAVRPRGRYSTMPVTQALARFIADKNFEVLPVAAVEQAKLCLLDTLGVIIAAAGTQYGKKAIDFCDRNGEGGTCRLICSNKQVGPALASFIYGTLVEVLEAQDGTRFGGTHPSCTVIPAALAIGETQRCSGRDLITAIVLGYDVTNRIAASVHPQRLYRGFNGNGVCGGFGSIAAGGKILGLREQEIAVAFGNGGFFAPISSVESFFEPSKKMTGSVPIKPMHAGMASYAGVLSVLLARDGFAGSSEILETNRRGGFLSLLSDSPRLQRITDDLGERYEIEEVYLKPFTACRHTHGGIQAALQIVSRRQRPFEDFEKVRVRTYKVGKTVVGERYTTPDTNFVTCQFSLPYMVTVALLDGQVGPAQLADDRIGDERVQRLAKRVVVEEDLSLTSAYPEKTSTNVEVHLADGTVLSEFVDIPKGDPRVPLSSEDVKEKFTRFTNGVLNATSQSKIIEAIDALEELPDINALICLLP